MARCKICGRYFEEGEGVTDFEDLSKPEFCSEECYEKHRAKADAQMGGWVGKCRRFHQRLGCLIIVILIIWAILSNSKEESPNETLDTDTKMEEVQNQ